MTAGRSLLSRGRRPQRLALALIHGAGSDLLSDEAAAEMRRRQPDMIYGKVPGRGHIPWLDEGRVRRSSGSGWGQ